MESFSRKLRKLLIFFRLDRERDLYPHEWGVVALIIFGMLTIGKIAWAAPDERWPKRNGSPVPIPEELVVISISGAVEKEGRYHFKKGTTVLQALEKAVLKEDADLTKLRLDKEIRRGQSLRVPLRKVKKQRLQRELQNS